MKIYAFAAVLSLTMSCKSSQESEGEALHLGNGTKANSQKVSLEESKDLAVEYVLSHMDSLDTKENSDRGAEEIKIRSEFFAVESIRKNTWFEVIVVVNDGEKGVRDPKDDFCRVRVIVPVNPREKIQYAADRDKGGCAGNKLARP